MTPNLAAACCRAYLTDEECAYVALRSRLHPEVLELAIELAPLGRGARGVALYLLDMARRASRGGSA